MSKEIDFTFVTRDEFLQFKTWFENKKTKETLQDEGFSYTVCEIIECCIEDAQRNFDEHPNLKEVDLYGYVDDQMEYKFGEWTPVFHCVSYIEEKFLVDFNEAIAAGYRTIYSIVKFYAEQELNELLDFYENKSQDF